MFSGSAFPVTFMLVNSCALVYSTEIRDSLHSVFCAHSQLYPNNAFWSVTSIVNNLPKLFAAVPGYHAPIAQSLPILMHLKSTVWNWLFRHNNLKWSYLIKLNPVATVSRAFGLKPLPNQSLHGRMPRTFLVNPCCPVWHSPWLLC